MTPSKSKTICEFNKDPAELVRLTLTEFKGKRYVDLRLYYDASEGETPDWKPSKKGVCLSVDLLDELKEGIEKAAAEVQGKNELSGLEEKGRDNGQTEEKQFGACMNGGGQGPDHDAKARLSREGRGEGSAKE